MIDKFALLLSHGLMLIAAWRLIFRPDLDNDRAGPAVPKPDLRGRAASPARRAPHD